MNDDFNITHSEYINQKYLDFYNQYKYIPAMFYPYNTKEIIDYSPTISCQSGSPGHIGNMLIIEEQNHER